MGQEALMKEKDFQRDFNKKNKIYGVFELKLCKGTSISFSAVTKHQRKCLYLSTTKRGFGYKIPDPPVFKKQKTRFNKKRPYDCFKIRNMPAYVVIMFWIPRKKKNVYYIPIMDFFKLYVNTRKIRKSMTEDMVKNSAKYSFNYFKKGVSNVKG
jgi:penicillin-binding protein-related factor A (putative recombinase)